MAVLGLAIYLVSYGPMITHMLPNGDELVESGSTLPVDLALLAALLAGVSLLPKAKNYAAVVAAVAVLGASAADRGHDRCVRPRLGAVGRAWAAGVVQAILAVSALLLDAGVITPPAPRPKYDQYGHYGQYGYYGQQQPYQSLSSPDTARSTAATRPGRRPAASARWPAVGTAAARRRASTGSPTPPTGFPSFSPPPSSGSGGPGQGNSANHGGSGHGQHSYGQGQQPQAPSSPSGPSQS